MTDLSASAILPGQAAMQAAQSNAKLQKLEATAAALNSLDVGETITAEELKKIEDASKDFESMFISEMVKPMFEGLEVDPVFGGGRGEEVFRGFMIQEYGKIITQSGGLGLSSFVRDEMIRLQTGKDPASILSVNPANSPANNNTQSILNSSANTTTGGSIDVAL